MLLMWAMFLKNAFEFLSIKVTESNLAPRFVYILNLRVT